MTNSMPSSSIEGDPFPKEDDFPPSWNEPIPPGPYDHPISGFTGTNCPVCGKPQMWCSGGVTCKDNHGFSDPNDVPDEQNAPKQSPVTRTGDRSPVSPPASAVQPAAPPSDEDVERPAWAAAIDAGPVTEPCPLCDGRMKRTPVGVACVRGHAFPSVEEALRIKAAQDNPQPDAKEAPQSPPPVQTLPEPVQATTEPSTANQEPARADPEPTPVKAEPERPRRTRRSQTGDRSPVAAPTEPAPAPTHVPDEPEPAKDDPVAESAYRRQQREAAARRIDALVLGDEYNRIIETVFLDHPWPVFEELVKHLQMEVPAHARTRTEVYDELDRAEDRARQAHQLYITAKENVRRFEADAVVAAVDMRDQATAALQREKTGGQRSKQITDADVESRIAALFPDEWHKLETQRSRARLMVEHMGRLAEQWKERARDLRSMFEGK